MQKPAYLTPEQAWDRARHFCNYRQRCHFEVKEKLFSLGLGKKEVELLVSRLIEADLLNEERYAILFAGGHFRQKKWGRLKIIHALRQKRVSEPVIRRAMKELDTPDYATSLQQLANTKWESLRHEQYINRQVKTAAFLRQRGFEPAAIQEAIARLRSMKKEQ